MKPFLVKSLLKKDHFEPTKKRKIKWWKILLAFVGLCFGVVLLTFIYAIITAPSLDAIRSFTFAESTIIYDKTGEHKLFTVYGEENRKIVSIDEVSQNFVNALLAAEDDDFFSHHGLDYGGITKAVCYEASSHLGLGTLGGFCPPRGGSTLTNQLVDNIFADQGRTYIQKLQEWYLSFRIESSMEKNEILELYMNKVSFGRVLGVETASQAFFGKSAKDLSVAEGAILAALVQKPTYYSPWGSHAFTDTTLSKEEIEQKGYTSYQEIYDLPGITILVGLRGQEVTLANDAIDYFPGRADWVLKRMKALNFINETEYQQATEDLKTLEFQEFRQDISAPHFVFYVQEVLEENFGKELIEKGGLEVITTIDYDLQTKAEEIISKRAEINEENFGAKNAALVSIETKTGYITTMVGSRDYWDNENDGQVNVILQKRLPGSSFKPIVYATAFLSGKLAPGSVLFDVETNFGAGWIPQNYDGKFNGPVSLREALGRSLNIPAIKACFIVGADKVVELSNQIGITLYNDADFFGNAIALGAGEVRPLDMAQGFSVLANNGKKIPLSPILLVRDRQGNILLDNRELPTEFEEVMDPQVAYLVTDVLSDTSARGPGWNQYLQLNGRPNAAKTGTSNKKINNRPMPLDAWTVGYTPDFTTIVWTGNNDSSVMYWNANGFDVAGPIWKEFMEEAHKEVEVKKFEVPTGIKIIPVSRFSGKLPLPDTDEKLITKEKFASFALPKDTDDALKIIEVEKISGKLPNEYTPAEALEKRAILNFHAYYPDKASWENPVKEWLSEKGREFVAEFGVEKFMAKAPTETTTLYTEELANQKPSITINSPINYGIVTPPFADVRTSIEAPNGVKNVEFFWNDELKTSSITYPYNGTITIPNGTERGSNHKIKVIVYDQYYYTSSAEIEVKIGSDDSPPEVEIKYPTKEESVPANTTVSFLVDAYDARSAVDRVDFYLDNKKIGSSKTSPYNLSYKTPSSLGRHTLKVTVFDTAGNQKTTETSFNISNEYNNSDKFAIFDPIDGKKVNEGDVVQVSVGVTKEMAENFEGLTIYLQKDGGKKIALAEFGVNDLSSERMFKTAFIQGINTSEIFAKVNFNGKNFYSERVKVYTKK